MRLHRLLEGPPQARTEKGEAATVLSAPTRSTAAYPEGRARRPTRNRTRPGDLVPWLLVILFVVGVILGGILVLSILGAPLS